MTKQNIEYYTKEVDGLIQQWEEGLIGEEENNLRKEDLIFRIENSTELSQNEKVLLLNKFYKEDTKDILLFEELGKNLLQVLNDYKNKDSKIDEFLKVACKVWDKHNKKDSIYIFKKVFFEYRVYNKLNLKSYFEDNEVCFLYNAKKDRLAVFGNPNDIKQSFIEWKEQQKKEKEKITTDEKLNNDFLKISKRYNKKEIENLIKKLNEYLHKNID